MDGGTTVKQLAWLIDIPLTVITNDISTAYILNDRPNIKLLICPGELVRKAAQPIVPRRCVT
jgi:DeoR/GlpR family transcriptional regulator of sugar metabolism